jgi:hypothetical protein
MAATGGAHTGRGAADLTYRRAPSHRVSSENGEPSEHARYSARGSRCPAWKNGPSGARLTVRCRLGLYDRQPTIVGGQPGRRRDRAKGAPTPIGTPPGPFYCLTRVTRARGRSRTEHRPCVPRQIAGAPLEPSADLRGITSTVFAALIRPVCAPEDGVVASVPLRSVCTPPRIRRATGAPPYGRKAESPARISRRRLRLG